MTEPTSRPAKKYHSIREVSEMLEVAPHVLRYWETQFSVLRPRKNRAGTRMYQERDLDILRSIREMLYERGYTISGARQRLLQERRRRVEESEPQAELDFLAPNDRKRLREVRDELARLLDLLREPEDRRAPATDISVESDGGRD